MMNNNLDINLNPTVSLNSIKYNSSRHWESFPYELCKVQPKMLQRDEVDMAVMMASISPLRGGISPADCFLPESFFLSGVFPLEAAAEYFSGRSLRLRVLGRMKYAKRHPQRWARVASMPR